MIRRSALLARLLVPVAAIQIIYLPSGHAQSAQAGAVRGAVRDKSTGEPAIGATVVLIGTSFAALTEADGSYVIDGVPPGRYQVQVVTYRNPEAATAIELAPGQSALIDLQIESGDFAGEVVIVTGTRSPEKVFDAPVTVESISEQTMKRAGGASYLSALSEVKGIDFADSGISDQRISARGFTTQFNSRMLTMVDGRMAQIPGNGLPQNNLLPNSSLDMKAVEVVVGPASALYGPNAHTGVINVITKTPWDQSGAALAVRGGTSSLLDTSARLAGTLRNDIGWKLNAQYLTAKDFEPDRDSQTHYYNSSFYEGDLIDGYDVESFKLDGSLYYRVSDWFAKATAGFSENDGFSLTNQGRNHIRGWQIQHQAVQISNPDWYAQITRTASNAGKTYQLNVLAARAQALADEGMTVTPTLLDPIRDVIKFVDKSQMIDSEVQHRLRFAGIEAAIGAQWRYYLPNSEGTFLADAGDEDIKAMEFGSYVQLDRSLLDQRLRLVGAIRLDDHTNYSLQLSPKVSAVYSVTPQHKVRVGYNRAFKSPTILENYLLIGQAARGNRGGYTIRDAGGAVVATIDPLEPEEVNAVEIGYKGTLGRRVFIDAVVHNSWYRNFISPLTRVANPNVDPTMDTPTFGYDSAGNIVGDGTLSTYVNFGEAQVRGADIGASLYPVDHVSVSASASLISLASFTKDSDVLRDLLLNVPELKLKGSVAVEGLGLDNYFVRLSGRFHTAHEFESGYWSSARFFEEEDGEVPSRFVLDVSAGYDIPRLGVAARAFLLNALGNTTIDVLGAPTPERLFYVQLEYTYPGLAF